MRSMTMTLLLTVVPSLAVAQSAGNEPSPTQGFTAQGRVQAEATLQTARDQGLPQQPLYAVMSEGQAKAATEAQILAAEQQALARLEAAQQAMVSAGHSAPSDAEVIRGASLMAGGVTSAELSAAVEQAPSSQSLTVALDALAESRIDAATSVDPGFGSTTAGATAGGAGDVGGNAADGSLSATATAAAGLGAR